ncbi:hypothetical protein EV122DRAFT_292059 [Schizophyllum commune]
MRKLRLLSSLMDQVPVCISGFNVDSTPLLSDTLDPESAAAPFRALEALRTLLGLGHNGGTVTPASLALEEQLLFFHVINCVRDVWPRVAACMDYLDSEAGRHQTDRALTVALSDAIITVIELKQYLPGRMESTPNIYRVIWALWLRPPSYASGDSMSLLQWHAGVGAALQIALTSPEHEGPDRVAALQVLDAVDHPPHDIFRQAIGCVNILLSLRGDESIGALCIAIIQEHLSLVDYIAEQVVPLPCHARDVVRSLVDVIRKLARIPGQSARGAADNACTILLSIWWTAKDYRSVVWALNDGILESFALLARAQVSSPRSDVLRELLTHIGIQSILLPVTRAIWRNGFEELLGRRCWNACPQSVGIVVSERIALMRTSYLKTCAYPRVSLLLF